MKISSKPEFHALVTSLCSFLSEDDIPIKTTRAQELLSRSLGYKSANGLFADLPVDITLTEEMSITFRDLLKGRHSVDYAGASKLLVWLEKEHRSYSTAWNSDYNCYPKKLPSNENYWYLTRAGWQPWSRMDFAEDRVELNIYKVVHSYFSPFLDEDSFTGSARPIWTADIGSLEFERESVKLEKEFGEMPERERMFSLP